MTETNAGAGAEGAGATAGAAGETKPAEGVTTPAAGATTPAGGETPAAGEATQLSAEELVLARELLTAHKAGSGPGTAAATVPDTYDLTYPEGFEDQKAGFEDMARRQGLSNEVAQKVVEALPEQYAEQTERFMVETKAHAEVGGDKLEGAELHAKLALDKFLPRDTPEGEALRQGLNMTGYGNWTPLVVLLSRIGKQLAEDQPGLAAQAAAGDGEPADAAAVLYGS